jgi:O-acetyl-ADP-ribose deacetylase (regulator of RNase III)
MKIIKGTLQLANPISHRGRVYPKPFTSQQNKIMKILTRKKGNLLTDETLTVVAHCANCQHTFGSGIALSIKNLYPAYAADTEAANNKSNKLGEISYVGLKRDDKPFVVFNLYGQHLYGTDSRKVNYEAVYVALEKMRNVCEMAKIDPKPTVGFPYKMGADRAGGDVRIIERMIEVVFEGYTGEVVIVEWDGS